MCSSDLLAALASQLGPLYADDEPTATALLAALASQLGPVPLSLDVPTSNPAATWLVARFGLAASSHRVRLVQGQPLALPLERIYAITGPEFG